MQRHIRDVAHSDRTRAAVVEVLARWTSLTAIFWPRGLTTPSSVMTGLGLHNQTLPQFPKPIYQEECRIVPSTSNGIEPTSSINSRRSERTWSEREKISEDSAGRVGNCGGMSMALAATPASKGRQVQVQDLKKPKCQVVFLEHCHNKSKQRVLVRKKTRARRSNWSKVDQRCRIRRLGVYWINNYHGKIETTTKLHAVKQVKRVGWILLRILSCCTSSTSYLGLVHRLVGSWVGAIAGKRHIWHPGPAQEHGYYMSRKKIKKHLNAMVPQAI